nr:hypothetical protein [Tanacetum cinerariifolium]
IRTLTDVNVNKLFQPWRSFGAVINKCLELTNEDIRNTTGYKEYYACATGNTQQYGAILPIELMNEDIRNTTTYKEYDACATRVAAPKLKASTRKKREDKTRQEEEESFDPIPRTPEESEDDGNNEEDQGLRLSDEEMIHEDEEAEDLYRDVNINQEDDEEETRQEEEESFDPIPRTPEDDEDDGNGDEDQGLRMSEEKRIQEEEEADALYHDIDINQGRGLQVSQNIKDSHVTLTPVHPDGLQESSSVSSFVTSMLNPISDACVESIFTTASSPIVSLQLPTPIMTPSTIATITTSADAPNPPTPIPSDQMTEVVREAVQIQTDRLQDSFQRENDEFLRTIDDNMKKIIKEQAAVLTRSSHSLRTSYAVAADLLEMELKKILIDKMEGNKSIQRSDEQRNLYKALVEAYDADKTILDTYGESTILKRRREDDDQEGPSARSDRGSKRRREGREHASASIHLK